ncbi:MAG: imelysin family protein [Pseudomonadota bacterium]
MRQFLAAALFTVVPAVGSADIATAVDTHVIPGFQAFAEATAVLDQAASDSCATDDIAEAYHNAFDAWLGVSHLTFGPIEDMGLTLSFAFWPDPKDQTGKTLNRLIADEDPVALEPSAYAEVSVAAQGFFALERTLFDTGSDSEYLCALTRAITSTLSANAAAVNAAWGTYAETVKSAGQEGNDRFRSPEEAQRALYTSLSTGLEFVHDQRLARPLGTFDRPRPRRAEARRSGRSLQNVAVSLAALRNLAVALGDSQVPEAEAAFDSALGRASQLDDPVFEGVADPAGRLRVEALQLQVRAAQIAVANEIGARYGISAGFNALDGD